MNNLITIKKLIVIGLSLVIYGSLNTALAKDNDCPAGFNLMCAQHIYNYSPYPWIVINLVSNDWSYSIVKPVAAASLTKNSDGTQTATPTKTELDYCVPSGYVTTFGTIIIKDPNGTTEGDSYGGWAYKGTSCPEIQHSMGCTGVVSLNRNPSPNLANGDVQIEPYNDWTTATPCAVPWSSNVQPPLYNKGPSP